ncbi:MAG: glutamine amidotransferase-related protein [Desulfomonilaceae bacterium]
MRSAFCGRVLRAASLGIVLVAWCCAAAHAEAPGARGVDTEMAAHHPWMMVALTPDGCAGGCRRLHSVVRELSGNPRGRIYHFSEVTLDLIAEIQPEFIILSPQGTPWCRYTGRRAVELQNFLWTLVAAVEHMHVPVLGVCGGHQALSLAFGGKVGPIRAGEDDCMPYTRDRQSGAVTLTQKTPDPIFTGIEDHFRIVQSHYDEVKALPANFTLLAEDKVSPNQIMRHRERPVYGIQGHPESSRSSDSPGTKLIRNFLDIAAGYNKVVRAIMVEKPRLLSFQKGAH